MEVGAMKKRIISGLLFAILGVTIVIIKNPLLDSIFVTLLALIAGFEFLRAFKKKGYNPISWITYAGCLGIMLIGNFVSEEYKILIYKMGISIFVVSIFIYLVMPKLNRTVMDIAITVLSLVYIPVLFSVIKLILMLENGRLLIWYVILGAFASDTFAYFVGCTWGKNKLCPSISPNKTREGALGGIAGVIISYIILTVIVNNYLNVNMNLYYWILIAIVASITGQLGDLTASAIKRYCGIKDFSNLIPGHGGILDRFDSLMFVAPIVYIFIKLYI
ncbi:MAG: phosphatidate cytidylyltransferase [Clostridia bacterium]|nr:phosphatidate cytidylyltransferase [Clostridia bacterium]